MNRVCVKAILTLILTAGFTVGLATSAHAQASAGVRAGASIDPDQFFFGGHVESGPIADRLRFRPNVEVGVGNSLTLVAFNVELAYHFPARNEWGFYAGGGPALNIVNFNDDTSSNGGVNVMLGVQHDRGLFFEFKLGFIDSPDVKIGLGYTFRR